MTRRLYHVWEFRDIDESFWHEHLSDFLPQRIIDAHVHVFDPKFQTIPTSAESRRSYWVNEVLEPISFADAKRCADVVFHKRLTDAVAFGPVSLDFDLDACNRDLVERAPHAGWHSLAVVAPDWPAQRVADLLDRPGVIGVKVYYQLISFSPESRDKHLESDIFDFLPHHQLEVLNDRGAWVTLHVPKADRLGHPSNIRQIREIRRRYPNVRLVIAHLGRSYTLPHAQESLPQLADDQGILFDCSAVLNKDVHRFAIETLGVCRIMYGSDNPVFFMRGRQQWHGRTYRYRTSHPFHFNSDREAPEIEANYTLLMYEALRSIRQASEQLGLSRADVNALFHDNARRVIDDIGKR